MLKEHRDSGVNKHVLERRQGRGEDAALCAQLNNWFNLSLNAFVCSLHNLHSLYDHVESRSTRQMIFSQHQINVS